MVYVPHHQQGCTRLANTPDGAQLSQETLHDDQLRTGNLVRLELKDTTGGYRTVAFHVVGVVGVVGVVTEFATAPRDSFVLADRCYLTRMTGFGAVQTR